MTLPPTWRVLGRRAHRLGLIFEYGRHEAAIRDASATIDCRFVSWTRDATDAIILRTAVAAALEQLELSRATSENP